MKLSGIFFFLHPFILNSLPYAFVCENDCISLSLAVVMCALKLFHAGFSPCFSYVITRFMCNINQVHIATERNEHIRVYTYEVLFFYIFIYLPMYAYI